MKRLLLKILLALFAFFIFGGIALTLWMRSGEEEALDYSFMDVEIGPSDPQINGFPYLRELYKTHEAEIPENYPLEYSDKHALEIDYDLFENWDLEFFQEILTANEAFLTATEEAFDRPVFFPDQVMTLKTLDEETMPVYLSLRSYVRLRLLEARVLALSGEPVAAMARLEDLFNELGQITRSGGGYIGILTSVAANQILLQEVSVYQANFEIPAEPLEALARNKDFTERYTEGVAVAFRQEFQFIRGAIGTIAGGQPLALEVHAIENPSAIRAFVQRIFIFVGLRENRTVNQFFRAQQEEIEQSQFPVSLRTYSYSDDMEEALKNRGLSGFINRNPYGRILLTLLYPSNRRILEKVDVAKATSSAAQISLALHAYYLVMGELPNQLNELVPDYLPGIPEDPFDGEPMRYSKENRIVYSVGNDLIDQGGSELPFLYQIDEESTYGGRPAESDEAEPTFPLRFAGEG